jgi:hypothetical protein
VGASLSTHPSQIALFLGLVWPTQDVFPFFFFFFYVFFFFFFYFNFHLHSLTCLVVSCLSFPFSVSSCFRSAPEETDRYSHSLSSWFLTSAQRLNCFITPFELITSGREVGNAYLWRYFVEQLFPRHRAYFKLAFYRNNLWGILTLSLRHPAMNG